MIRTKRGAGLTVSIGLDLPSFCCLSVPTESRIETVSWRTITGLSSNPSLIVEIALT